MKNKILILAAVLISFGAYAQKNVTLTVKNKLGSSPFAFNQASTNNLSENFNITRIDYYMSGFTIIHDGGMQTPVPASKVVMVTGNTNHVAYLGSFNVTNVEGIKFYIGVDANTNATVEPSIASAPLDVFNMWWGWASGYRFVAIEGNGGPSLNQNFQYHGLFDANYFSQTVMAAGVNNGNDVTINLDADYTQAVKDVNVAQGGSFHGVNTKDLKVLQNFRDNVFSAGTGFPTAISEFEKQANVSIFPNPSSGKVHLNFDNTGKTLITTVDVYDMAGRKISQISTAGGNEADLNFAIPGMYFLQLNSYGVNVATKKVVIQ